jgi:hypothetical protein
VKHPVRSVAETIFPSYLSDLRDFMTRGLRAPRKSIPVTGGVIARSGVHRNGERQRKQRGDHVVDPADDDFASPEKSAGKSPRLPSVRAFRNERHDFAPSRERRYRYVSRLGHKPSLPYDTLKRAKERVKIVRGISVVA